MIDIPIICYSHSSYSDLWEMFFGQVNKYFYRSKQYLFTDKADGIHDKQVVLFDDNKSYPERVTNCLESVKEDMCIFMHEDMILYDTPVYSKLYKIITFLREYNIDYVKLLRGGHDENIALDDMPIDNLWWIPHSSTRLSFAIQPTIWKVDKLLEVYRESAKPTIQGIAAIGNFETGASDYVNNSNIKGLYWYDDEKKRGRHHWDSYLFPHGNFISKGRWVYSEYSKELTQLHKEYNIDKNIRGVI